MRALRSWGLGLLLALGFRPALAGPLDLQGFGARAPAMAHATVADPQDLSTVFFNPAGLDGPGEGGLYLGGAWSSPKLFIRSQDDDVAAPATAPFASLAVGVRVSAGRLAGGAVAVGAGLVVPSHNLLRAESVDPATPHFIRYQSQLDAFAAILAASWTSADGALAVGAGVQTLLDLGGDLAFELDVVGGRLERREVSVDVGPSPSPVLGLLWRPASAADMRLGAAWRGASGLDYDLPLGLDLGPPLTFELRLRGTAQYEPHRVCLGAAWDLPTGAGGPWTLSVQVDWALWSQAPDPAPTLSADLGGALLEGLGLGRGLDVRGRPASAGLRQRDTATPRAGAQWRPSASWAIRAGLAWLPTATPPPEGPSNYADSDAWLVTGGVGWDASAATTVDAALQWVAHQDRRVSKTDPADPVGDYVIGGRAVTVQAGLRHRF